MKITILGAGNMGTALAVVAGENEENKVILWTIEKEVIFDINSEHENSKYLKGVKLSRNIKAITVLRTALEDADVVVFALPSHVVRSVAVEAKDLIPENAVIVDVAKGLESNSNKRMSEVIGEYFSNPIVVIGGPSIANELGVKVPTFVVFASTSEEALSIAKDVFETSYYNITPSSDIVGVELCGVLKNIIAILAGVSDGLGYGVNTKSGIIAKGLNELGLVCEVMGGLKETVFSLAGVGDLVVTCMSSDSRNRRFGELIGGGASKEEALKKVGQVVEGEKAVVIAKKICDEKGLNCELINKVYNIVVLNEKPSV